jgi:polyhydroxyalkanoate synthesis regulator phasin
MADQGQKKGDPGDVFREGVRAVTGVIGAFKDAIEQTFNDLSASGDMAPDRAREAARDAMKRAQEAMDDMRERVDFVTRREFDDLKAELAALRAQVEGHTTSGVHHAHGAGGSTHAPGTAGTGAGDTGTTGAAGSSEGTGSPGL